MVSGGAKPETIKGLCRDDADKCLMELEAQHLANKQATHARHNEHDALCDIFPD